MKQRRLAWLKLVATTLLLPTIILAAGSWYMAALDRELRLKDFETEAGELLESMRYVAVTEKYLCKSISEIFDRNPGGTALKNELEQFMKNHQLTASYLIWTDDGSVHYSNFDWQAVSGDWQKAYLDMRDIIDRPAAARKMPEKSLLNLRQIFGPHFFPRYYHMSFSGRFLSLLRTDASNSRRLVWMNFADDYGLCVFFEHKVIEDSCGLHNFVFNEQHELMLGYLDENKVMTGVPGLAEELQPHVDRFQGSFSHLHEIAGYKLVTNFISPKQTGFCAIKSLTIESYESSAWFNTALAVMLAVMLMFAALSYRLIVGQISISVRLTRQLLFLFIVSNLLPGFVLLVIGSDYLQQLRRGLVSDSFNKSSSYLQNIDELYISELTIQKDRMEQAQTELIAALKKNQINRASIRGFIDKQSPSPYRFFLVASDSGIVAGHRGIIKNGKVQEAFTKSFKKDDVQLNTADAVHKLGSYVLHTLNRRAVTKKAGTEVEFVIETLMQRTPIELIQMFIELDSFWHWALGTKSYPTYLKMLKIFEPGLYDYLLLYLWDSYDLEIAFMERIYHNLNRNEFGLKIVAVDERFDRAFPPEALQNQRLKDFLLKMRDRTITRPEFCNIEGADYLLVGHKCIFMENLRLLALYPVERIDNAVSAKKSLLLMFVFVSFLVSVSLGLFVSGSIVGPLATLQTGVEAMHKRDFAHRLPDLGGDEFGHLARIFNETLVDLEELHVARIVQEKIMTQMEEPLKSGNLLIFGQTISLSGMGGDYFEVFDNIAAKPAVLLGDVAGSGVSTSLILAFVKSAVMQLHKYSAESAKFLERLNHVLLNSSRQGQRKSFACQYLHFSGENAVSIANAGLPYPIVIDHLRLTVSSLAMPAVPLGCSSAFQSGRVDLQLLAGQSLICFSSGFSQHGRIEYDKIVDLIRNSIDPDPQQFCKNCFANYFMLASRSECRDDISLLIIHNPEAPNHGTQNS
ncbi:MAG: hypothetical protein CVV41_09000 [Candidatus Riflebacteria bacterium HGW-Riflebacteria-1]|jgi:hypothetical protein|nr:MAG: hypothetical protein CVV41_09000 [Candidatus Riflebacteria bacterium HGW-Riflebacteria-1]